MGVLRRAASGHYNSYVQLKRPVNPGKTPDEMKVHYDNICFYDYGSKSNFSNPIDERLFMGKWILFRI